VLLVLDYSNLAFPRYVSVLLHENRAAHEEKKEKEKEKEPYNCLIVNLGWEMCGDWASNANSCGDCATGNGLISVECISSETFIPIISLCYLVL
jgi:hypothetical protein